MTTDTTNVAPPTRQDPRQVSNTIKRTINWNDADVTLAAFANSLPLGAFITGIHVDVVTAFNGTSTLKAGTTASYNTLIDTTDVDITATGCTAVNRGLGRSFAASADINPVAVVSIGGATAGKLIIALTYDGGWDT